MPWVKIGESFLTKNWYYTTATDGELFRLKHQISSTTNYIKAVCAPAFIDDGVNILTPRRISYRNEAELITFQIPKGIESFKLAMRRLDDSNIVWKVSVEVFAGYSSVQNLVDQIDNQLVVELEELIMDYLYQRGNALNISPKSKTIDLTADIPAELVDAEPKRAKLIVRCNVDTKLYADFDETTGNLSNLIEDVRAGEVFLLPDVNGGIYKGIVYAVSEMDSKVTYTEYKA